MTVDLHLIKNIYVLFVIFIAIACIIYQALDMCACSERCRCTRNKKITPITENQEDLENQGDP